MQLASPLVFTVEQRAALRERVLRLAEDDDRVVAGAAVGSLAVGDGDRFSDLDLTFGIADHGAVTEVLDDWTTTLIDELGAVQLADLVREPTVYRVFLLPDRVWQAEHYVGAVRDHALSLACLRRELPAVQARGYDELPPDTLAGFDGTCAGSVEPDALRAALAASVRALLHEGAEADLAHAVVVAERLSALH
jgi:hypothetical protein